MLTLLVALLAGAALADGSSLRGVSPDLVSHYSGSGGTFTCLTGVSKTIPFARVNDDYCDCPDGSDEPGTSACHNGRFYCRNLGHEPQLLASSFVDDGVCDCCDGTDEPKGKCKNTCLQASAVHKEALKTKISKYQQALQAKAGYVLKARAFKAELQLKAGTIEDDLVRQSEEVQRLKDEVAKLEQEEAAASAAEAERLALEQAAQQAANEAAQAQEASGTGSSESGDVPAPESTEDGSHEERELQEKSDTQLEEREETPEERGRRIASQWTNDPEAAAVSESQEQVTEDEHQEGHYDGDDVPGDYDRGTELGTEDDQDEHHEEQQHHQQHQQYNRAPRRPDPSTPLGAARARLYDAETVLSGLQTDKEHIRTYLQLGLDFGPDDVFLALADRCFSSYQTRWTYEICMFKNAVQREGYSNTVTVGRWYGFGDDYTKMHFTGGDECWNVGPRSLTVSMSCGNEEKLSDGEEPGTCAYTAKFTTPALCSDAELEELEQQLRNLEAFEKEVQALISKDEL